MVFVLLVGAALATWALLGNRSQPTSAITNAGTDADAGTDAGTGVDADTDADADTATDAATAPSLTPHEREEAAKDELARARKALLDGDIATANEALDRATEYDPSNEPRTCPRVAGS